MKTYLGLDGGGTKTAAVIIDDTGRVLGRGTGGACNIATLEDDSLREAVSTAAAEARYNVGIPDAERFAGVCAGVAGFTARQRRETFTHLLKEAIPAAAHRVEADFTIAWWGATEGRPGIIVSAGTGAVAYGRNEAGREWRVDGRGFLLGDKGSAFDMGIRALRYAMELLDEGKPPDVFTSAVLQFVGCEDGDDIVEWTYRHFQPGRIAGLAPIIGELADAGLDVAVWLITCAAGCLRESVVEILRRLEIGRDTPVYPHGGLWSISPLLRKVLQNGSGTGQHPPILNIAEPLHDAAYGAALLAKRSHQEAFR